MSSGFVVSEMIDRPLDEVWQYLTDFRRAPNWMKGLKSMAPLTEGPVREGSRYAARLMGPGRRSQQENQIVLWKPRERFALEAREGGLVANYEYICEPVGNRTRVTLNARCKTRGMMWRTLSPAITFMMKRTDGSQLQLLKCAIEGK